LLGFSALSDADCFNDPMSLWSKRPDERPGDGRHPSGSPGDGDHHFNDLVMDETPDCPRRRVGTSGSPKSTVPTPAMRRKRGGSITVNRTLAVLHRAQGSAHCADGPFMILHIRRSTRRNWSTVSSGLSCTDLEARPDCAVSALTVLNTGNHVVEARLTGPSWRGAPCDAACGGEAWLHAGCG